MIILNEFDSVAARELKDEVNPARISQKVAYGKALPMENFIHWGGASSKAFCVWRNGPMD